MKYLLYFPLLFLFVNNSSPDQPGGKKPFIEFRSTTLSFDTVITGTIVKGEFVFRNIGNEPLIITNVQAADGGTIAAWPQLPIQPGTEDKIQVRLNTTARNGFQDK